MGRSASRERDEEKKRRRRSRSRSEEERRRKKKDRRDQEKERSSRKDSRRDRDKDRERGKDYSRDRDRERSRRDHDRDSHRTSREVGRDNRDRDRDRDRSSKDARQDSRHSRDAAGGAFNDMLRNYKDRDYKGMDEGGQSREEKGSRHSNGDREPGPPKAATEEEDVDEPVNEAEIEMMMEDDPDSKEERLNEERKRRRAEILARHQNGQGKLGKAEPVVAEEAPEAAAAPAPVESSLNGSADSMEGAPSSPTRQEERVVVSPDGGVEQTRPSDDSSTNKNAAPADDSQSVDDVPPTNQSKDAFDIFSSSPTAAVTSTTTGQAIKHADVAVQGEDTTDGEGYYKTRIGELIGERYLVKGAIGKGVFSTVLSCQDTQADGNRIVAIKMIRNNDLMRKAAQKEVELLQDISSKDLENRRHCIQLLSHFDHRNHTSMVFESMQMNLRETLKKFGKNVGINIKSVKTYAKQLMIALKHIASLRIVHADIKPDNILVSEDHRTLKICDFGSAFRETAPDNDPTPYIQSRFYRAPEITLGLEYNRQIDIWSIGVCLFELFTGKVMFQGIDSNAMLQAWQDLKGRFPNRMIKRHIISYSELERVPHFEDDFKFRQQTTDKVTGKGVLRLIDISAKPMKDLRRMLMSSKAGADDQKLVLQLADIMDKVLNLDPEKRLSVAAALKHPFCAKS